MYIFMYLSSIVLANYLAGTLGPNYTPYIAFVFIGFDLTCRDKLHELWHNEHLKSKMFFLILSGSVLSYLINKNIQPIATASCAAFGCAAVVDFVIYSLLYSQKRFIKVNGSNIPSAVVDSIVFIGLAFGAPILWSIVLKQIVAKIIGGLVWGYILGNKILLRDR